MGRFLISAEFPGARAGQVAHLAIQGLSREQATDRLSGSIVFGEIELSAGPAELESWLGTRAADGRPSTVRVTRIGNR
jgi:hypothetical protein